MYATLVVRMPRPSKIENEYSETALIPTKELVGRARDGENEALAQSTMAKAIFFMIIFPKKMLVEVVLGSLNLVLRKKKPISD